MNRREIINKSKTLFANQLVKKFTNTVPYCIRAEPTEKEFESDLL
jgi:hypothetical protein